MFWHTKPFPSWGLISEKFVKSSSWSRNLCTHNSSRSMINHLTFYTLKKALVWLNSWGREAQNFLSFMELFNRHNEKSLTSKTFLTAQKSLKELVQIGIRAFPLGALEWPIDASKFDIKFKFQTWNYFSPHRNRNKCDTISGFFRKLASQKPWQRLTYSHNRKARKEVSKSEHEKRRLPWHFTSLNDERREASWKLFCRKKCSQSLCLQGIFEDFVKFNHGTFANYL